MNETEIEIKLQLNECDYVKLDNLLNKIESVKTQKHQIDIYYSPSNESYYNSGDRCLRVRKEGEDTLLSYKRIFNENTTSQFIKEYETHVDNFDMIDIILEELSFRKEIVVDKLRKEYFLKTGFLVALDIVDGLGYFIEIENCNETDALEKRNRDLYQFIEYLGINIEHRNTEGYSNMLFRKKYMQGDNKN